MKEQTFFNDPAVDRLMGVVFQLASEVYILKDRVKALEKLLEENGIIPAEAVENSAEVLSPEEREKFINRIFEPIIQAEKASSHVAEEYQLE
ncbi:MAG: hypothetical protein D6687_05230 [Acidobacteria bacterium]|jgi:hypothetical protein|nr:MAG: hypothetical protein D6687_05230 [Acidobacteriota bacterium]GIU82804.1 MAG: hypothetical protein KatS3mg006_1868 [Pyrinomonadaceae bacterium]